MLELRLLNDNDITLVEGWLNKEHIKRWYEVPGDCSIDDWVYEIENRHVEFQFLTHLIAIYDGRPIGFCQYYKCIDSDEGWGALQLAGAYCIDYFIGEELYLGKGLGKGIITQLVDKIFTLPDAERVVADIGEGNKASEKALLSSGFVLFDTECNRYKIEKVLIKSYSLNEEDELFSLIEREGLEWTYWQGENRARYKRALEECDVYLAYEGETLCGYVRVRDDFGFGVYIVDLLVDKHYRGKGYGRMLMEQVCLDFPHSAVYVMSGVDPYYEKLGYEVEGTIFTLQSAK